MKMVCLLAVVMLMHESTTNAVAQVPDTSLALVRDGQPEATILIQANPTMVVQLAACELQHYLKKISGATVPIVREPGEVDGNVILVGGSRATEVLGLRAEDFAHREFLVQTRAGMLILMGLDTLMEGELDYEGDLRPLVPITFAPLGSCHAVHTFLENHLGVRWYLPTEIGEVVPHQDTIRIGPIDIRRTPQAADSDRNQFAINPSQYVHDYTFVEGAPVPMTLAALDYDRDYDLRSGILYWIRHKVWGGESFRSNHSFHGWDLAFGRDHPDWFSTKSWKKMQDLIQEPEGFQTKINPVLSHPEVVAKKVEIIRGYFDGKPEPFHEAYYAAAGNCFGICLNDNGNWSQDPACVEQYEPGMGHAGSVSRYFWSFVNRVAREVGKTHPHGEIVGLAYWSYTLPPKPPFELEPNVSVMLCKFPILYWNEEYRNHDYEQIETWIRYGAKHIYTWEYLIWPPISRAFPSILPRTYAEDAKWLASHPQFKGGYLQMYGFGLQSTDGGRTAGALWENPVNYFFNAYFRWKIYDDPSRDIDAMLDTFYDEFFGPAAVSMRRFVEAIEDRWNDGSMRESSGFGQVDADMPLAFYWEHMGDAATVDRLDRIMDEARAAAPVGSVHAERVALMDRGILGHMKVKRNQYLRGAGSAD